MADDRVEATIDMEDDAVIVPVGVIGAAAGGGLGGALGTEDLMAEEDPTNENLALTDEKQPVAEESDDPLAQPLGSEEPVR
jgi:hypothetical protein